MWGVRDDRGWLFFDGSFQEGRNLAVECGKPPRVFAHDIPKVFRLDRRGPWLGYDERFGPARLYALDPWEATAPRPLPPYLLGLVDDHVMLGDASAANGVSLWRAKLGDAFELEYVPLDLDVPEGRYAHWTFFPPIRDQVELVFVRVESTTFGFDPRTGERRFVEDKTLRDAKLGGRFAVLMDVATGSGPHTVVVDTRDPWRRSTPTPLELGWSREESDAVVFHEYDRDDIVGTLIITLPDLNELWLEGEWTTWATGGPTPEGRRVLQGPGGLYLLEPGSSNPRLVHPHRGSSMIIGNDLWVMHTTWPVPAQTTPHERTLVRVPLDGSEATTVLEPPIASWQLLPGGRWALTRDTRGDVTDLHVYDPATGHEEVLVEGIDLDFARWNHDGIASQYALSRHDFLDPLWPVRASELQSTDAAPHDTILFSQTFEDRRVVWRITP